MEQTGPLRNRVKELRERLGLRQSDLANEVGVTRQTVIAVEKGRFNPSVLLGLRIARVLREPLDYVFYLPRAEDGASVDGGAEFAAEGSPAPRLSGKGRRKRKAEGEEVAPSEALTEPVHTAEPAPLADEEEASTEPATAGGGAEVEWQVVAAMPDPAQEQPEPDEAECEVEPPAPAAEPIPERHVVQEAAPASAEQDEEARFEVAPPEEAALDVLPEPVEPEPPAVEEGHSADDIHTREGKGGQAIWDFS